MTGESIRSKIQTQLLSLRSLTQYKMKIVEGSKMLLTLTSWTRQDLRKDIRNNILYLKDLVKKMNVRKFTLIHKDRKYSSTVRILHISLLVQMRLINLVTCLKLKNSLLVNVANMKIFQEIYFTPKDHLKIQRQCFIILRTLMQVSS